MASKKNNSNYFRWLCARIDRHSEYTYWELLQLLNDYPFSWSVPNDDNRLEDGLRLRELYLESHPSFLPILPSEPCSVLEVLVALTDRMQDILAVPRRKGGKAKWFWEMMNNLGLDQFHDQNFYQARDHGVLHFILIQFMNRTYNRNGQGSLFPSKKTSKNLARVEIWYQLMNYLDENYAE